MANPTKQIELRSDKKANPSDVSITDGDVKIKLGLEDLRGKGEVEIVTLDVDNDEGLTARFWIAVEVVNGRPRAKVTTKPYARKDEEVSQTVCGSCNIL